MAYCDHVISLVSGSVYSWRQLQAAVRRNVYLLAQAEFAALLL